MSGTPTDDAYVAALGEYQASMRRSKWPPLVFLLAFAAGAAVAQGLHWKVAGLAIVVVGLIVSTVMVLRNLRVQRPAAKKLHELTRRQASPK